jgi:hypothetical protein
MEWAYISLVKSRRICGRRYADMPGVPWTWSHLKPWIRPRAQQNLGTNQLIGGGSIDVAEIKCLWKLRDSQDRKNARTGQEWSSSP